MGTTIQVHGCGQVGTWVQYVVRLGRYVVRLGRYVVRLGRYISTVRGYGLLVRGYGWIKVHRYGHVSHVGTW